jgi:hypothetical protein
LQGQAKDAQAVAMETKREAEILREEAEKAELDMVSAASVREGHRKQEQEAQKQAQAQRPPAPSANGYPGYGQPLAPPVGHGYGQPPPQPSQGHGYGQQPPTAPAQTYQYNSMAPAPMAAAPWAPQPVDGGFAAGVMGGGGGAFDLPSPNEMTQIAGDAYANPFG